MTHSKREKLTNNNKDTRWDRIRKRYCNNTTTSLKSDAVKKFIEIDYIGKHHQNILNGKMDMENNLDPVLVMDLRHEMFKKTRKLPIATVAYSKNLHQCKAHNIAVEDHYIENQLNQFRLHLQKQHKLNKVPEKKINSLLIDNADIIKSLETTQKHMEDFYNTPIEALQEVHDLFTEQLEKQIKIAEDEEDLERKIYNEINFLEQKENDQDFANNDKDMSENEEETKDHSLLYMAKRKEELNMTKDVIDFFVDNENVDNCQRTPSPLANTEEVLRPLRDMVEEQKALNLRCVRFDCDVNVYELKREASICSNTSDGIDSVISDLAEEALKELEMEEECKLADSTFVIKTIEPNLCVKGSSVQASSNDNQDLVITGEVSFFNQPLIDTKQDLIHYTLSMDETEEEAYINREQFKIIKQLFQARPDNNTSILRKYFSKWLHYTTIEKIEREHVDGRADRVKKINIFLNKIRIEKSRLKKCCKADDGENHKNKLQKKESMETVQINKKYQNKIKIQQDIIDLQRLKLERQERIIMELKLHKLSEEAKEAREELKKELKSVIRSGDPKSKAKAKCLQLVGNLKDEDDDLFNKLQGKALLVPKFLQNMQERALERSIRHEQARQRRLQQEAEKEAQKLALDEAKRLEDEEAKRLRIEALKEKRRQEKMAKIIKERERQKYIENQRKAQVFYKRYLLRRIGMEGFKRLLQRKRDNLKKCAELRNSLYMKTYFQAWFSIYRIYKARRNQKADELYEKIIKRKYINIWLHYVHEERCKLNVAIDYNDYKLTENQFRQWRMYTKRMKMIEETKMNQAQSHHEWHLKWKVLDCWQRLPQILKLEKETEERRQRWRLKIWELLPDYTPNRDVSTFM